MTSPSSTPPVLVLTQGDPAGIGPEIVARVALDAVSTPAPAWRPLMVVERAALRPLEAALPDLAWDRLRPIRSGSHAEIARELAAVPAGEVPVLDPTDSPRQVTPGRPQPLDATAALAALDLGVALVRPNGGPAVGDALVTAPLSKIEIARHVAPDFRGHTDHLAQRAGLARYGRDYLMTFLAPDLRVALLSTHRPLDAAIAHVRRETVLEALLCLHRHLGAAAGPIAVAGLDPHAGEGGLLGTADAEHVRPAVEEARRRGLDVCGPESADSLFARARAGEFRWVLALYHDQGLIAVKTAAFGQATNWTLGLPYLRTSVDHGTAYELAGRGLARVDSLRAVISETLRLVTLRPEKAGDRVL
ncbi:MAG: 4-hydroxythreonine-4-phosphate dehydrogenase PdxA [Acidobacteriota bacterium]